MSTNRWAGAKCVERIDLPWTADATPEPAELAAMSALCVGCPAAVRCANHAVTTGDGGFYAGIWVPWAAQSRPLMATRRHARAALRHIAQRIAVTV